MSSNVIEASSISLDAGDKAYAIPSTGTLKLAVTVKNMANGTKVNLSEVKCWLDTGKDKTVTPTDTTVSSKTNYNVGIKDFTWEVGKTRKYFPLWHLQPLPSRTIRLQPALVQRGYKRKNTAYRKKNTKKLSPYSPKKSCA